MEYEIVSHGCGVLLRCHLVIHVRERGIVVLG